MSDFGMTAPSPAARGLIKGSVSMADRPETTDLNATYTQACLAYHRACQAVEAAEDMRDAARRECDRLERMMYRV